jgi:hypothetical protein
MKTIIEQADGRTFEYEDLAPMVVQLDEGGLAVSLVDADMGCYGDEVPLEHIRRVVFEP